MKCGNVKKELELMFEGVKPGEGALSHIKSCEKCRAEYEAMLKITGALSGMKDVKVPAGFNKTVWNRIGEPAPSIFGRAFVPVFALSGAAAAALVLFLVFFARPAVLKPQDNTASKPPVKKERTIKKEIMQNREVNAPVAQVPAAAQDKAAPVKKEETAAVSGGNMPAVIKSAGADRELAVKPADETAKVTAASVTKRPVDMEGPLTVKNNVIKPLSGQGMTIIYKVEDACNVLIRVYNRKGEPVKTLVSSQQVSGVYTAIWSGEDANNQVVGDGIYVVHIKTCLTEQKIKAMVVK